MVELRVHGVAGSTAEALLGHSDVVQFAGDESAGFYRARPDHGGATTGVRVPTVEAYRWGGLTGGAAAMTTLSLLLLPFMLINLAVWLRPTAVDRFLLLPRLCRLLGATLTVAFVLSIATAALDLVGWQCASAPACRSGRPFLAWLGALPVGARLAVLAVVPLAALAVVWVIGSRHARAFEGYGVAEPGRVPDRLDAPGFWDDGRVVARLRRVHLCLGIATVDGVLLAGVSPFGGAVARLMPFAALLFLGWCAALLWWPRDVRQMPPSRTDRLLIPVAVVLTVATLGHVTRLSDGGPYPGQLPGLEGMVAALVAVQAGLLIALTAVTLRGLARGAARRRLALLGFGTPIVAAAATSVGLCFSTALVYRLADWLDRGALPDPAHLAAAGGPPLQPAVSYWWAALAVLATLLAATTTALGSMLLTRRRRRRIADDIVRQDFPDPPPQAQARLREVREAIARSRLVEQLVPALVASLAICALALFSVTLDLFGAGPTQLADRLDDQVPAARAVAYFADVGIYLVSLLVVGLGMVGTLAYRSPETRRLVAVVWDLGAFWPRLVHPFAPPSYGRRAVPELGRRTEELARGRGVVLSGHSQGSVLAVAALLQLPPPTLGRIALVTHGSPLHRLYARLCPAYLGETMLRDVAERLDWRWRNLWRDTDPLAGPVFPAIRGGRVDVRLRDPATLANRDGRSAPPVEGHGPYHTQRGYEQVISDLAGALPPPEPG